MNFIHHIRLALKLLADRTDATPHHVSLYVALFIQWNEERFPESVMIIRAEIMQAAHIGSASTYLKCLRELTAYGLITYQPSRSPHRASRCLMHGLSPTRLSPDVSQAVYSKTPTTRTKSGAITSSESGASTGASRGQAVVSFDKQVETIENKNKPVLSSKLDEAAAEKKEGFASSPPSQLLEQDDSMLTAQEPRPKAEVARKGKGASKSSGSPLNRRAAGGEAQRRPEIPFAESELAELTAFTTAFSGTDYALADLRFYHEKILNWRQNGDVPRRRDWLATSKQFFLNDAADNRLKLAPGVQSHQPGATYADTGIPTTGYRTSRYD